MRSSSVTARFAPRRCRRPRGRRSRSSRAARAVGAARRRALHARDDDRDERAARTQGRAHRVRDERRLRASAAPAAAEPRRSLPALRRTSGAARSAGALRRRARAHGAGRASSSRSTSTRCRSSTPKQSAICLLHAYRDPSHERAVAAEVRRRLPDAHVVASHEIAPGVPRVRTCVDDRDRRVPRPGGRALPACARGALRRGGSAGAARHALVGRRGGARGRGRASGRRARLRAGRRRRRRGEGRTRGRLRQRDRVRHGRDLDRRLPHRRRRERAHVRARRRRLSGSSTDGRLCTRSAPAAARSSGATRAARCASGRRARARNPGRLATGAAARGRRSPTRTCCSDACPRELAAGVDARLRGGGARRSTASIRPRRSRS